jgi:hypothetical protein
LLAITLAGGLLSLAAGTALLIVAPETGSLPAVMLAGCALLIDTLEAGSLLAAMVTG